MKVLIVTAAWKPELSGISEATFSRVMELARLSACRIRVLAPDYSAYAAILPRYGDYIGQITPNVEVKTYPTRVVKSVTRVSTEARLPQPFWKYSFASAFEEFRPDVIHVEEPCRMFGLRLFDGHLKRIGVAYKRARRVPATCMWRTDYFEYAKTVYGPRRARVLVGLLRPVFAWVYNAYDRTFCGSLAAQTKLAWAGVRNIVQVQSHSVDMNKFKRLPTVRNDEACKLLYVGRVSKEKNIGQMLKAFHILAKRHPNLKLAIVGNGPLYDQLSREYSNDQRVKFHDKIENDRLPEIYSENDVFINPSHTETFGMTTLEACACSMPVVVADRGGFLTDGDEKRFRCLRYKHDDCADLVDKIERLVVDRKLRALLGSNARDVASAYDNRSVAANFYGEWLKLVEGGRIRRGVKPAGVDGSHVEA